MNEFQEKQSSDMMNLKVKIQNATAICRRVAKFYSITLEEGKPEHLFVVIEHFVAMLQAAKRSLLKLEKERYVVVGRSKLEFFEMFEILVKCLEF